jgi:hypothetical protein
VFHVKHGEAGSMLFHVNKCFAGAIARRRFAAIGAIQPKPTFQISYTRRQHRVLLLQRKIARLQLANKG